MLRKACHRIVIILVIGSVLFTAGQCKAKRKLVIEGSNTMLPIMKLVERIYEKENPDVDLIISGPGSEAGLDALRNGTIDIATSSREVYPGEMDKLKAAGPVEAREVAYDCLLLVVNRNNSIESMRLEEASNIFTGKTKNWKELGGEDRPIVPVVRNDKSGSADYFKEHVLRLLDLGEKENELAKDRQYSSEAIVVENNTEMSEKIDNDLGAIGFMGMGSAEKVHMARVKTLNYARVPQEKPVAPTIENVYNRTYRLSRPLYLVFHPGKNPDADALADWMISDEGQRVIKSAGYLRNTMEEIQVTEQKPKTENGEAEKNGSEK
ncbi:MAG: phosphate ABC transporter substrate-binding protein [Leptospiraceae bacterium]|nr:phosphate ABC transporter substrate-binding protein [Leptospiraceae bacterium]